ncbi:PREDICTED: nuclear speckle splicing regulatory protein 1 [Ceratosolen solmsi marchali]|uniref:Nuclear speckle splicing regulatory protein 1 n=1 Tax=Ceratosolen solmsi marchali TaxID=326594 RepID=A0AAJ6YI28_9HYME|nr:PREDICTED: nuclear speckle splicing regulatory protein 1 [Ceratosolen solmsi marchali]
MANKKQYGLILPKKNQLSTPKAGNVFGNDDESEEEEGTDWVKKALKVENERNKIKKQTKLNMQKALRENPTIFQYDEVYDEIERTKEEDKCVKNVKQKAKYIDNLLKSADLRKKEQELRKDRMIQKEIEAEDAIFPDKERYVTSSYKAKLEEMKKFEEERKNQDRLEAIADVTKQSDMSGFYRHLYRQTVNRNNSDLGIVSKEEKSKNKNNIVTKIIRESDKDDSIDSNSESEESSKSDIENSKDTPKSTVIIKKKNKRQYRKRADDTSEPESEQELEKKENNEIDQLKLEEIKGNKIEKNVKKQKLLDEGDTKINEENSKPMKDETLKERAENSEKHDEDSTIKNRIVAIEEKKSQPEVQKRINIWAKRTIGKAFDDALQKYLIRKQERLAGSY